MAIAYKNQWGTLFVLFRARKAMTPSQVVELFGPVLSKKYGTTQKPALWTKKIALVTRMDFVNEIAAYEGVAKPYLVNIGSSSDMDETFDHFRLTQMQAGEPDPAGERILHAVKWNVRRRDKRAVTKDDGLEVRSALRSLFRSRPKLKSEYVDFEPYGTAPGRSMPVPSLPALPKQPVKPVPPPVPAPIPVAKKKSPWPYIFAVIAGAKLIAG